MRARMKALEGVAVRWDGTNTAELQAVAGEAFIRVSGTVAFVRNLDGEEAHMDPGDVAVRWDGVGGVVVSAPGAWGVQAEELA